MLSRIREQYVGKPEEQKIEKHLEIHAREYFINAFLAALNWRMDRQPTDDLPNLLPEVPVRSEETDRIRFLDYLGIERETDRPLLIVETKRPEAELPRTLTPAATYSEIISRGLRGKRLLGSWEKWLNTLKDYVRSVHSRTNHCPARVVITNGNWLILFLDPHDAFLDDGSADPMQILVFESRKAIENRFSEVFRFLEYFHVSREVPPLTPGELPAYLAGREIDMALHGLRLLYIEQRKIYEGPSPVIKVAPVVFLRTRQGTSVRVESPPQEYELPHKYEELRSHLNEVDQAARELLEAVNRQLGTSLKASPLTEHYDNEDDFTVPPTVREQSRDEFLVITGDKTHYLLPEPSIPDCPFHDWQECQWQGVPSNPGPLLSRSVNPRSFFVSGELHHCAHREVRNAKAIPATGLNRTDYGAHSGEEGQAFCKIWRFEQYLCCRTCAFEEVCIRTGIFHLPCHLD